jgi:hypothetical protein
MWCVWCVWRVVVVVNLCCSFAPFPSTKYTHTPPDRTKVRKFSMECLANLRALVASHSDGASPTQSEFHEAMTAVVGPHLVQDLKRREDLVTDLANERGPNSLAIAAMWLASDPCERQNAVALVLAALLQTATGGGLSIVVLVPSARATREFASTLSCFLSHMLQPASFSSVSLQTEDNCMTLQCSSQCEGEGVVVGQASDLPNQVRVCSVSHPPCLKSLEPDVIVIQDAHLLADKTLNTVVSPWLLREADTVLVATGSAAQASVPCEQTNSFAAWFNQDEPVGTSSNFRRVRS